ncbi:MAG: class I lanthipeptide [Chitinophaga sp.]|uniref:class I lanthipeptide n=1 Tax=Chitinophaga sp. TaxID=1869181 RepID=UPI0025BDCB4F|nr:class I lanthipeptide [Chitinophaga sp.]MBV8253002.1 class I lanthipeptide [Chitinophaga sp.]
MKKKKLSLDKKLTLNKEAVAFLNASQKEAVAGGIPPLTFKITCITSQDTCETVPPMQPECIYC